MKTTQVISARSIVRILGLFFLTCPAFAQTGEWQVNTNGFPATFSLAQQGEKYIGYLNSGSCNEKLDSVALEGKTLSFRRLLGGITQWYEAEIIEGSVMVGRFAHLAGSKAPKPSPLAYKYHITGWNEAAFPITPVVFDINVNGFRGRLRIDRQGENLLGRLKMYAYGNELREELEEEISVSHWDGESLAFTRGPQTYTGEVSGRNISGSFTCAGRTRSWSGRRAEVLGYGLAGKTLEEREAWQVKTRRILSRLMMAGNPEPASVNVEILAEGLPPISGSLYPLRDDDPGSYPQNYTLTELRFTYTIPGQFGLSTRTVHAYLAKPTTPPPGGLEKYPLVVALNGHLGSAYKVLDGSTLFYYGDAWARRGYMVLAVDIPHRPIADVSRFGSPADLSTYLGYAYPMDPGDDVEHGNGVRASIKPNGLDAYYTDWEEDGERVWDVMRAIDYAVERGDVDADRIAVTGLSMGGEVASYVGALDTRIKAVITAGYSPDLNVVKYKAAGHCWNWSFADIREYLDQSDVLALVAGRQLIVQTGKIDNAHSLSPYPFAADKQVVRRARMAGGEIVHYLHPLGHEYRTGVVTYTLNDSQTDASTTSDGRTLFDYVRTYLNF